MMTERTAGSALLRSTPSTRTLSLGLAALGGGAAILLAALWRPDAPMQLPAPPGMKVGEHELTLSAASGQGSRSPPDLQRTGARARAHR